MNWTKKKTKQNKKTKKNSGNRRKLVDDQRKIMAKFSSKRQSFREFILNYFFSAAKIKKGANLKIGAQQAHVTTAFDV